MGTVYGMSLPNIFLTIFLSFQLISTSAGLKCYVCDSITGDSCDDTSDRPGKLQICPQDRNAGCFMSEVIAGEGKTTVSKGCTALDDDEMYKCEVHTVGGHAFTFCNCHGDECNKDWGTAAGPKIKCYVCDSLSEKCDDNYPGSLKECPIESRKGCFISKASYGDTTAYERGCSEASDPSLFGCKDISHNNQELHFCNCHGDECNKNWDSAQRGATGSAVTTVVSFITILCGILIMYL